MADGDAAGHAETIQTCIRLLEKGVRQFRTPETAAGLHEALGSVRLTEGKAQEASEHFREADAQWQTIDRVYDRVRVLNGLSHALIKSKDDDGARVACDQATEIVESLAAQLDAEELKKSFLNSALVREILERRTGR